MNIVLIGIQGSGKGTLVSSLEKYLDLNVISTGQLLRDEVATGSELGKHIKQIQMNGGLVELNIVMDVLNKKLKSNNKKITVFDGFPRNMEQANALDKLAKPDLVIYLNLTREVAVDRILSRLTCSKCGQIYNAKRINTNVCPNCGGKLEQRFDDTIESINKRFESFYKETYPLIDKYKKENVLFEVDASGTPDEVCNTCLRIINEHNN